MMKLSQAALALGCKMFGPDVEFKTVSTDSRKIVAGDLFVALRGENFDGFEFVVPSLEAGAVAAVVNADSYAKHGSIFNAQFSILVVEDTRLALGKLAAQWRKQFNIPVVGITGSNGKTSVKEMLAGILREQTGSADEVLATIGNLNNDIGMPLTLLKLRPSHRYAVIEMGMNHPGEIDYLTHIAVPQVALLNNAGSAHLAGLGTVEAVAKAKGEIFAGLSPQGVAVINADDDHAEAWRVMAHAHRVLNFGLDHKADIYATYEPQEFGNRIYVRTPQGSFKTNLHVPGEHNVRNALAATAAAVALEIPLAVIAEGLLKFAGVAGRLQRKPALKGAVLLDDTYNANPASLHAALEVLSRIPGQKILVLGDMGELGADATHFHAEIGAEARNLGIQKLLALGDLSTYAVDEFGNGATHFKRIEDLLANLEQHLEVGCTVLVKGSRFMKMERVVQHCTALQ
ncbi:MAG: UDP-N-acetylmuramoyl-tripeptide--D-alanyl-D-alanine ligase [Gallionellaceae bacterium]|nr:UDP-N-acetylmuramoyl-tripeptide--D-alanyl-D-alanine ligase [Gallionellaceae bacterium]